MIKKEIILNKDIDTAVIASVISESNKYSSEILFMKEERIANGKSLLGIASLELKKGDKLTLSADGFDEQSALSVLHRLLL